MNGKSVSRASILSVAIATAVLGWLLALKFYARWQKATDDLQMARQEATSTKENQDKQMDTDVKQMNAAREEMLRQLDQLRSKAKEAEKLRDENQKLKLDNNHLRDAASARQAAPAPTQAAPAAADQFPRDSWNFAGYATPEAALISSIWSMKEGNPKSYLDSLAPEEQARMAKVWENKSEAEVAAKHQQDVSAITGMRILDRKPISAEEVQMNVYIQGVDRMEKVSMKLIDNQWKFAGFIREPKK